MVYKHEAQITLPWSQRFFLIFLRERDQEQATKRRQRVAKAMRRERKTSGYLGLESHFHADESCQTLHIVNKKSDQWQFSKHVLISRYFFLTGGRLGKLCYEQTISTWVVKSYLLIGVKLKHVLTMGDKSPGIRTPLYKETNIVPNDCCRICRHQVTTEILYTLYTFHVRLIKW